MEPAFPQLDSLKDHSRVLQRYCEQFDPYFSADSFLCGSGECRQRPLQPPRMLGCYNIRASQASHIP